MIKPEVPMLGPIQFSHRLSTYPYEEGVFAPHIHVRVYHSRRKTIGVYPFENEIIELRVPNGFTYEDAVGFVTENEQELLKKLNTALNLQFGVDLESFTYDSKVPFFGKNIPIRQLLESGDCDNYFGDGAVYLKQGLSGMEIYEAVLGLIGKIAYKILKPKIDRYAELMAVKYSSLEIDDGRRTFGSFNDITKVIFLSRRLLMMSESVINFLIVHELAHGKHFTHDRNHEAVMGTILPEYEDCDRMFNASCCQLIEQGWI